MCRLNARVLEDSISLINNYFCIFCILALVPKIDSIPYALWLLDAAGITCHVWVIPNFVFTPRTHFAEILGESPYFVHFVSVSLHGSSQWVLIRLPRLESRSTVINQEASSAFMCTLLL